MSSQDVTNGLKAHMGPLTSELSSCVKPSVTILDLRFLGSRKALESFRQNNSPAYFPLDKICAELTDAERSVGSSSSRMTCDKPRCLGLFVERFPSRHPA
jgi:hypothetical protein